MSRSVHIGRTRRAELVGNIIGAAQSTVGAHWLAAAVAFLCRTWLRLHGYVPCPHCYAGVMVAGEFECFRCMEPGHYL